MPRPVDQVTADERAKGRPGLVRLAAPRYPEKYPDKILRVVDGEPVRDAKNDLVYDPHPQAGQPHPQANQVIRGAVRFRDEDTGDRISVHSTGPAFWTEDGTAVDTDLTAGPPGFLAAGKAELGFGFRLRGNGGFITDHPAGGTVEVGGPEYLSPTGWRILPLTQRQIVENRVEWDTPQGLFIVAVKGGLVITELLVASAEHLTGWRQAVSVKPPALSRGRFEAGFLYYDSPQVDETTKWPLRVGL